MAEELKEAEGVLVEEDAWKDLVGKAWTEWPDDPRNLHTAGAQCSLWGRSVADMGEQEMILFIGFLDTLCTQQNSMIHYYVDRDKAAAEEAEARAKEITDGAEVAD